MGCDIIQLGESGTAIICGGKKDHECNSDSSVLLLRSGERVENTEENFEKYKDEIGGGSVCCTICGRAAFDDAMYL